MTEHLDSAREWLARSSARCRNYPAILQADATMATAFALTSIAEQLVLLNEGRDQFHREVLEVLTQAKADPGPCPSTAPPVFQDGPTDFCSLRAGHDGLHESRGGVVWTWGEPDEGPSGAGATAQGVEKEGS